MSTETTNYGFIKPEANDLIDITTQWNNNIDLADAALAEADFYNVSLEVWTGGSDTVPNVTNEAALGGTFTGLNRLGPRITEQDFNGAVTSWSFVRSGVYRINAKLQVNASVVTTEATAGLFFKSDIGIVPGMKTSVAMHSSSTYIISLEVSSILYIHTGPDLNNPWFDLNNTFGFYVSWLANPAADGVFSDGYLTIERIKDA